MPKWVKCNLCGHKTTLPLKEHEQTDECRLDVFYSNSDSESDGPQDDCTDSDTSGSYYYLTRTESEGESEDGSDDELLSL